MYSVSSRCNMVKQPRGGYIPASFFDVIQLEDHMEMFETENLAGNIVGTTVDYLSRFMAGSSVQDAFSISIKGARLAKKTEEALELLAQIRGLDDTSIVSACKLSGFDVFLRRGPDSVPLSENKPDAQTTSNIRTMVNRCETFWSQYGPVVLDGFCFPEGYTPVISSGDGDYLTKTTVWDLKVLRKEPSSQNRLQLYVYYLMGRHSLLPEFFSIENMGIFNPRKNKVYYCPVSRISKETRTLVCHDVIGYGWSDEQYDEFRQNELAKMMVVKEE